MYAAKDESSGLSGKSASALIIEKAYKDRSTFKSLDFSVLRSIWQEILKFYTEKNKRYWNIRAPFDGP